MDSRTLKLKQQIDAFMEHPPTGVPEQMLEQINEVREMLSAPRYSGESPGEQEAREVAEATMPKDVADNYYSDPGEESENSNVGVFNTTS